jgi:NTP pyrophosphatase (non-canonical NTP hydrolase)
MPKGFLEILEIARDNIRQNPSLAGRTTKDLSEEYLKGLIDEVEEVSVEVKENNAVFLADELSDIAWDYACVLALLEDGGYIESAEGVLAHGFKKYSQRAPAFLDVTEEPWNIVKAKQKEELKQRHEEKYGNK